LLCRRVANVLGSREHQLQLKAGEWHASSQWLCAAAADPSSPTSRNYSYRKLPLRAARKALTGLVMRALRVTASPLADVWRRRRCLVDGNVTVKTSLGRRSSTWQGNGIASEGCHEYFPRPMATTGVVCFSRDSDSGSAKITTSHDLSSATHLGSVRDLVTLWLAGWREREASRRAKSSLAYECME